jgi:hypothetical protein
MKPAFLSHQNRFSKGPECWCSYDYHASMVNGGTNVFVLATWSKGGGPGGRNHIWTDHTRWSADTPEKPLSILPLLFYRSWVGADPIDLRGREISLYLRGDKLELDGADCHFWVRAVDTRWHFNSRCLAIGRNRWGRNPERFRLESDESRWHRSWTNDPATALSLDQTLRRARSYGFSFVGFSAEVTGRLSLADFRISR